jgi:hypothetical protein
MQDETQRTQVGGRPDSVPLGYGLLPQGVVCKCIHMWSEGPDHYCCRPNPPLVLCAVLGIEEWQLAMLRPEQDADLGAKKP